MLERKSKALLRRSYSMYECIVYQYQTKSIVLWCILCFCPETQNDFNRFSSIFQQSPVLDQLDHPNQQEFLVPTTLDKATETSMTNAQYEMYEDSPDSTTSSTSTSVSIKQEPGYDEAHQRVAI